MNSRAFDTYVACGLIQVSVIAGKRSSITVEGHELVENTHYVVCRECGAFLANMSVRHLVSCCGLSREEYQEHYPTAPMVSGLTSIRRAKTEKQRRTQSEVLRKRFKTPEGLETKNQISHASKDPQRLAVATANLKRLNQTPERRAQVSRQFKSLWQTPDFVAKQKVWRDKNHERVLQSALHARKHLKHTFTKPHQRLKAALDEAALVQFRTEFPVGYYSIDEAYPELRIALEVDGCYWHGCSKCGYLSKNACLDKRKNTFLRNRGWIVVRLKECKIKQDLSACVSMVVNLVQQREALSA